MVRSQVKKVVVAEGHGGERKQKKDCLQEIQKAGFRPTLSSFISSLWAWKLLLFIGLERGQSCLQWGKNISPWFDLSDPNRWLKVCTSNCQIWQSKAADWTRWPIWANKRSRFRVFLPDRTILEDKGVSGGHFGARVVEFGGQTRQKTRPEVGHSGSSVGKKMNSIFFFIIIQNGAVWIKNREFCWISI